MIVTSVGRSKYGRALRISIRKVLHVLFKVADNVSNYFEVKVNIV